MLKLFGHPVSQPSRAVAQLLRIHNEPHEYIRMTPIDGSTVTPAFLAHFPLGCVPCIEESKPDDGSVFRLGEGAAILQYLAETRNWESWYPTSKESVKQRAKIHEFLSWHTGALRMCTDDAFRPKMLAFMKKSKSDISTNPLLPTSKIGMTMEEETAFLDKLEKTAVADLVGNGLSKTRFLCGETPTVADLLAYCELDQLDDDVGVRMLGGIRKRNPDFNRWMLDMRKLPCHDDVRKPLKKLTALMLQK